MDSFFLTVPHINLYEKLNIMYIIFQTIIQSNILRQKTDMNNSIYNYCIYIEGFTGKAPGVTVISSWIALIWQLGSRTAV